VIVLRTTHVPTPAERRAHWRVRYDQLTVEQQLAIESPRTCPKTLGGQAEAVDNADAASTATPSAGGVAVPACPPAQVSPAQPANIRARSRAKGGRP
jgi:hypothetical protein